MSLLTFADINVSNDPPRLVNPWKNPNIFRDKLIFFILILLPLRFLILRIEKKMRKTDAIKIKFNLSLMFSTITKPKIKKGILFLRILFANLKFFSLYTLICNKLIIIEYGSKIFRTSKKLYPNKRNVGVPSSKRPTPKIDWSMQNKEIKNTSIKFIENSLDYKYKYSLISKYLSKIYMEIKFISPELKNSNKTKFLNKKW